jgi:hypothetical protein
MRKRVSADGLTLRPRQWTMFDKLKTNLLQSDQILTVDSCRTGPMERESF